MFSFSLDLDLFSLDLDLMAPFIKVVSAGGYALMGLLLIMGLCALASLILPDPKKLRDPNEKRSELYAKIEKLNAELEELRTQDESAEKSAQPPIS